MSWLLIVAAIFQIACARQNVTRHNSSLRSNSNLFQENRARTPRIIGGSNAQVGRYPYMVSLLSRSGFHSCGGVLVAKDLVLTAAHCSGSLGRAHVGRWNRFQYSNDVYDNIAIIKEYIHPLYVGDTNDDDLTYDFALLQLEENSNNNPVLLNSKFFVPNQNQIITAIGFGRTQPGDGNSEAVILQEVDLNYLPNDQCDQSNDGNDSYEGLIKPPMMCAQADGKDACFGDSGGPLLLKRENAATPNAPDVLVGLTSWGYGCADPNFPGVYARVSHQSGWLTEMICQLSDSPPQSYYNCPTFGDDGDVPVVVQLTFDDYPAETSWKLSCNNGIVYGQGALGKYGDEPRGRAEEKVYVPSGSTCTFIVKDEYGDGLCCDAVGNYKVFLFEDPSQVYATGGGDFGAEATHTFQAPTNNGGEGTDAIIGEGQIPLVVNLLLDDFPKEIGWQVDRIGVDATTVYNFPPGTYRTPGARVVKTVMLQDNQIYTFRITDSEGDGMPGGTIQLLLGTQDISDRSMAIFEKRGGDMSDSFETTFTSWMNNGPTTPPTIGNGDKYVTLQLGLDIYPQEIGFQLRVRDRSATNISRNDADDGEIVVFRPQGYYANRVKELVYEQIELPTLPPNMERDFIFIISDQYGDGLCCDWGSEEVSPGYSIYEGEATEENLILSSEMKDIGRELKYFTLPSEQRGPAPTIAPTEETSSEAVAIEVSLSFSDPSGSSRFFIEDVSTGNRIVNYPCSPNVGTTRTYSIPTGVYSFTIDEECGKIGSSPYTMEYEVKLQGKNPNRPPLLQGSRQGSDTFMVLGNDVPTIPMSLEFTTSVDPSSFSYYVKRLDILEADAYLMQVPTFSLSADTFYIQALSIQQGGLYRIALEGVTQTSIVNSEVIMKIGDESYPIRFPGLQTSEEQYIKFLAGSLPSVSPEGPSLTLRVKYDNAPLDFEYVLLESGGDGETATARTFGARKLPNHRIYAFGPKNETLVASLSLKEHVEILPLPSYSGEKTFTLLLSDSGGDGLCCKQGAGGPIELFDGPISDNKLLFEDSFQGTNRLFYSFVREGDMSSSAFKASQVLVGILCVPVLLFWML